MIETLLQCGVSRVSLGVQSFTRTGKLRLWGGYTSVARFSMTLRSLRAVGITSLSTFDLIAGLPHQTAESWRQSLEA